ncbi:MAG: phosphatase PAP2 family protein, partial [Planctomycetaceae bacterium]
MAGHDDNPAATVDELADARIGWRSAQAPVAGRREITAAAVFLAITAATMSAVLAGATLEIDDAVLQQFQQLRTARFDVVVLQVTALGNVTTLVAVAVGLAIVLRFALNGADRTTLFIIANLLGARLVHMVLRAIVDRPRPVPVETVFAVDSSSFPSGHAMMSMVVYLTFALLFAEHVAERRPRNALIALAVLLVVAIGMSRLYLGVHYASDVVAGLSAGM